MGSHGWYGVSSRSTYLHLARRVSVPIGARRNFLNFLQSQPVSLFRLSLVSSWSAAPGRAGVRSPFSTVRCRAPQQRLNTHCHLPVTAAPRSPTGCIGARGNFLNFLALRHPVGRVSLSGFSWTSGLCEVARALSPKELCRGLRVQPNTPGLLLSTGSPRSPTGSQPPGVCVAPWPVSRCVDPISRFRTTRPSDEALNGCQVHNCRE